MQLSVMRGDAGCGKTFLALDLSLHVAAGLDWFGRRVNQGAVIYIAAEAGRGIINRVAAFKRAHGCDDDAAVPFAAVTSAVDLCHAEAGDEVTGIRTATIVKQRDGPTEGQIAFSAAPSRARLQC
jgi:hypothetical protein